MTSGLALLLALAVGPADGSAAIAPPPRLLVFTVSAGFVHDVVRRPSEPAGGPVAGVPKPADLSLVERTLVEMGVEGGFEAVPSRDPAVFAPAELAKFDGVLFYTTGELPLSAEQRAGLLDFVAKGKGFVGIHCATDTFYEWPEYG